MGTRQIKKAIEHFCAEVDANTDKTNYGGCGVVAYILSHQVSQLVKKNMVAGCRIRVGLFSAPDGFDCPSEVYFEQIARNVARKRDMSCWMYHDITFDHIVTEINLTPTLRPIIVDSENIVKSPNRWNEDDVKFTEPTTGSVLMRGSMGITTLKHLVIQKGGWNSSFDRRQIPTIASLAKKHLAIPFGLKPVSVDQWDMGV